MCKFCNQVMMQARESADFYERAKMGYDEDDNYYDSREHHVDTSNTYSSSSSSSSSQLSYNYTGRSYTSSNTATTTSTSTDSAINADVEIVACKVITSSKEEPSASTAVADSTVKPLISSTATSSTGNKKEYIKLVKKWAKSALKSLSSTMTFAMDDVVISVSEVVCGEPGCPPLEVQILVFLDDKSPPTQIRVLKALADTKEEDVSSAFSEQFGKDGDEKSKAPIHSNNASSSSSTATVNVTPSITSSTTMTQQASYTPPVSSVAVVDESSWRFRKVQRDFDDVDRELSRSIW